MDQQNKLTEQEKLVFILDKLEKSSTNSKRKERLKVIKQKVLIKMQEKSH